MNTQPATLHSAVHRLQDTAFLGAYTLALRQNAALLRGKSVLVLGDGCGFLSVVVAQAGAGKVYALEDSELCDLVPKLAASNGVAPGVIVPVRAPNPSRHAGRGSHATVNGEAPHVAMVSPDSGSPPPLAGGAALQGGRLRYRPSM